MYLYRQIAVCNSMFILGV